MSEFISKIREYAGKYKMLRKKTALVCVSGGADSMSLLDVMSNLTDENGGQMVCLHFDHRLRGEESDRDREFVRSYCEERGIAVKIGYGDTRETAEKNGAGIEETARTLRYNFFNVIADEYHGEAEIVTAHNADDNAETMLLNLARGAGTRGLAGIPPVRDRIVRPLLCVTRAEIEKYLQSRNIPHIEDSTNAEIDAARNKIRHMVMPVLREINAGFTEHALKTAMLLREDDEYIQRQAGDFVREHAAERAVPVRSFMALPKPVAARATANLSGVRLSSGRIADIYDLCRTEAGIKSLDLPGVLVRRERGILKFLNPREKRR